MGNGYVIVEKKYAFLKKFWAIFWPILGKTRIPAKALKLVWDSWKLPSMRSLGELGTILSRFFHLYMSLFN